MSENIFDNVFDQKYDCSDDSCEEIPALGSFPIFVNPSTCAAPQEVNINYGTIGATGNLVAGNNIALAGNLSDRILGSGNVTISAVLPPIQSPLTFENGLRESSGIVKLGLDLTTIGTTNTGALTEDTGLILGDIPSAAYNGLFISSNGTDLSARTGPFDYFQLYFNNPSKDGWFRKGILNQDSIQEIAFEGEDNLFIVRDDINQKGLQYTSQYDGTSDPLWIPHWGAVTNYTDTELGNYIPRGDVLPSDLGYSVSTNSNVPVFGESGSWSTSIRALSDNIGNTIAIRVAGGQLRVSNPINNLDAVNLQYLTSQKGVPNGIATLDAGGTVPVSQLPDSIFGQMRFGGTYDGSTIIASESFPELDGQPLPAATGYEGVYFISTQDYINGGIQYHTGDWIVSTGLIWTKVDNTDAVTTVFGRSGNILAVESDYESFYPRLSQSYDNPSWINSLDYSKLTNVPATPTLQSVTEAGLSTDKGLVVLSNSSSTPIGANRLVIHALPAGRMTYYGVGGTALADHAELSLSSFSPVYLVNKHGDARSGLRLVEETGSTAGASFYNPDGGLIRAAGADALLDNEFTTLGQLNAALGSYLPLSGGGMSGNIDMGRNLIDNASQFRAGSIIDGYSARIYSNTGVSVLGLRTDDIGVDWSLEVNSNADIGNLRVRGPVIPSETAVQSTKALFYPRDNRSSIGNPNIEVAQFFGSVIGRMDGTSDPDGYEGQFATQPYVDAAISGLDFTSLPGFGLSWNSTTNKIDWGTELSSGIHGVLVPDGEALYMGKIGGFMSNLGAITTASSTNGGIGYTAPVTGVVQHGFSFYNAPSGGYTGTTPPVVFTDNLNIGGLHYADDYSSNYTDRSIPDVGWVNAQIASLPTPTAQTLSLGASSGEIAISGGNTIALKSLSRETSFTTDIITAFDPLPYGLHPFSNSSGSTGFPANGSGIYNKRLSETQLGSFAIWTGVSGNNSLYYNIGSGTSSFNGWQTFASQEWTDTKDFLVSQAITDLTDANRFDRQSSFLSSSSSSYVPFTGNGVGLHLKYSTVNRGAQIWIPLNEAYAPQYRGMTSTSSWDSVKEFVVGGVNQTAIGGNKEWSGEHTFSQNILFNKTLSAGNKLIDLQQGYSIWSDNVGSLGSTTRLWFDAPNEGGMVFGPRGSLSKLTSLRVRANVSNFEGSIELPTAWSPTAANHVATKGYVDSQSALEPLDEGNGIGYRVRGGVAANYGNIGQRAVDFSYSSSASTINGATGLRAVAFGFNTRASGNSSVAFGQNSAATNTSSVAFGSGQATGVRAVSFGGTAAGENSLTFGDTDNSANARNTFVGGSDNIANSPFVMVGGRYNDPIVTTPTDTYTNGMPLFIIGNGNGAANRANALTIYGDEFGKTMDVQSDIEIGKLSGRLILKSPDGTRWAITVDNSGIVSAAAI